jgi:hypothetical protein
MNRMLLEIALPPAELRKHVSVLIATGLAQTRPSCVVVEKIKATELEAVANFVIGGILGIASASAKKN